MGLGFLSRKIGILRAGDERILSAYVYYFALPALLFIDLAELPIERVDVNFIIAGITPIIITVSIYLMLYYLLHFSRDTFYLLILSTVFGSLAFFGIPFVMFSLSSEAEFLATIAVSSISLIGVFISIFVLEFYTMKDTSILIGLKRTLTRLSKNPLILSISIGLFISSLNVDIPRYIYTPIRMLGGTTATVAIFMLGVFLYGRRYTNLNYALKLSMLRIVLLPSIALLIAALFNLSRTPAAVLLIMHNVPVAVSMMVLSERYNFHKETIASLILVSSVGAAVYINLWLLILNLLWG
ncbi:AEC family transporter [Candidatus Bathyarchaeota archaeon]|nr:AEC family transporter [Candidatus Bathyarchaeota archaeon]